jgi:ankyrin repeat protein
MTALLGRLGSRTPTPKLLVLSHKLADLVLETILSDDADRLAELLLDLESPDLLFEIGSYKLPVMISHRPSIPAVAAFFGAENCFRALLSLETTVDVTSLALFAAAGGSLPIFRELENLGLDLSSDQSQFSVLLGPAVAMGHLHIVQWLWTKGISLSDAEGTPANPLYLASLLGHFEIVQFLVDVGGSTPSEVPSASSSTASRSTFPSLASNGSGKPVDLSSARILPFPMPKPPKLPAGVISAVPNKSGKPRFTFSLASPPADATSADRSSSTADKKPVQFSLSSLFAKPAGATMPSFSFGTSSNPTQPSAPAGRASFTFGQTHDSDRFLEGAAGDSLVSIPDRTFLVQRRLPSCTLPLHGACRGGHADIASYLLSIDPRVAYSDSSCLTPLDVAILNGHVECVRVIAGFEGVDEAVIRFGIAEAAANGRLDVMGIFCEFGFKLNEPDWAGMTPMVAAIANGQFPVVRFLFEHGVDIRDPGLLEEAVAASQFDIFLYLLDQSGLDLEADGTGRSLLQQALNRGDAKVIDLLVDRGTSLDGLCMSKLLRDRGLFDRVLSRGGDINAVGGPGVAPPIIVNICQNGLAGAAEFLSLGATLTGEMIGANPEVVDRAVVEKDPALLEFLLGYEPDLSGCHHAIRLLLDEWRRVTGITIASFPPRARLRPLLEHGARGLHDPADSPEPGGDFPSSHGTPVDIAISKGSIEVLQLFDEFGFDWRTVTCRWAPSSPKQEAIYEFLLERGARFEAPRPRKNTTFTFSDQWIK